MAAAKGSKEEAPHIIQTDRLILRLADPRIEEDCEQVLQMYLDLQSRKGEKAKVGVSSLEDVRYKLSLHHPRAELCTLAPPPRGTVFLIFLRDTISGQAVEGDYIGTSSMCFRAEMPYPDLGWTIFDEYQGQGYATEAGCAALKFWTETIGVEEVCVVTGEENERSHRLAERIGFVKAGLIGLLSGFPPEDTRIVGRGFVLPGMEWREGLTLRAQVRPEGWRLEG